jgi:hypothetical protein
MVRPTGRLVLLDFGTAGAATAATRRQDTLAVAQLIYTVLSGRDPTQDSPIEPVRRYAPKVNQATERMLTWALQPTNGEAPLTLGALRRVILESRQAASVHSGICPYCQATTRGEARHCIVCGSPLLHEPLPGPPPALVEAAEFTAARVLPPVPTFYQNRLRILGRLIDREPLWNVTLRETAEGFAVRGARGRPAQAGGVDDAAGAPPEELSREVRAADLDALALQARQGRDDVAGGTAPTRVDVAAGTLLFPTGYEDGLRALGYQLDERGDVRDLVIAETPEGLVLDYNLLAPDPGAWPLPRHLALTTSDMEAIVAEAIDRRGSG